jgi:hypothetical protein
MLERRGEIPHVAKRADSKGRRYPVRARTTRRSTASSVGISAVARQEANTIMAFARLLHEGETGRHLQELLRLLEDEKARIAAMPQSQRVALARGFLDLLQISPADLTPISAVPAAAWGLQHDHRKES